MSPKRTVHLPVASLDSVQEFVDIAVRAEELGYERAWIPETWGRNVVPILTRVAEETSEMGLGTSIVNVYSRSPALLGQTAVTLQEVSDGRMRLGIGPSGPIVVEGWHGADFGNPLRRTRESIDVIRQVVSGEEVDYEGEYFNLSGFRLRCDPPEEPPAVDAAGMGPKAVELCGRFADGWHATLFTPDGLRERMDDFRRGADLGDRDVDDLTATLSLGTCALDDGDRARRLAREHLVFYVGAMGTYYRESLSRQGFEEEANEIAAKYASGDRDGAMEALPDELLDEMGASGTPERAREELRKFEEVDGLDSLAVSFPRGASFEEIDRTLAALAPE
ncbi:TIGR04024 family LLM class F420-dependent oxidoreductase [Halobacteriales archaeon QS_8_69_26]|nr:MAG: TIGR04024 family LLM class F420-dependent oxidoreductase [Halobacteriales archaeon QS_8_69_26]